MSFCRYYQAQVVPTQCWFFVGVLRSFEHVCFDRTRDTATSTFEFFVPEDQRGIFLQLMHYFSEQGIISAFQELPNRLLDPDARFDG